MNTLSTNWLTEGLIDFEYKKYFLLAYLKEVSHNFDDHKLYPYLSDVIEHYKNLLSIKDKKRSVSEKFPAKIASIDLQKFMISYEKVIRDNELMEELENIIEFSIPEFEKYVNEGKEIYDYIEDFINISPVGVTPLDPNSGYFFLQNGIREKTLVYEFQITLFEKSDEKYRGIYTNYINTYQTNLSMTLESLKHKIIKTYKIYINPATYFIESDIIFPLEETLLPIAKRSLVKFIADAA